MLHNFKNERLHGLESVLSTRRFGTYLTYMDNDRDNAIRLYCWNAEVSAAFYILLHYCELAIRNGAVEAIEGAYSKDWYLCQAFLFTLRNPAQRYNPNADLRNCILRLLKNDLNADTKRYLNVGFNADAIRCLTVELNSSPKKLAKANKLVPELKFVFWQNLFVKGYQAKIWDKQFAVAFPGYDRSKELERARYSLYKDINQVRVFRNRIAHHEPIFDRRLSQDRDRIMRIIKWRQPQAARWLERVETVTKLIKNEPQFQIRKLRRIGC